MVRPAPKTICILLPVWGDEFINQFLEQSLPTLLAPGNIPALAKTLPTRFVFLTRASDETTIRAHPAFHQLSSISDVEILPIDDLITPGNHSTTVTLAYTRAVRQTGEAMLDICFFFLVSDYIMADGSLAAVLLRMQAGASAVQVGNFQIDEETAEPWLLNRLADAGSSLAISPREMMRWAFGCLHRITAANIVNFPLCHNTHANRLLWRVDAETLIGRFYLLHMICIRPEIVDFIVGSSCDYSFVPEMCPSGDVVTITDSDDYLVVEIQPDSHERNFFRFGRVSIDGLAQHLSEWTTGRHRANAEQTIVFHAAALPALLPSMIREAEDFIRQIEVRLVPTPQPHRNHPYWKGAIAAFDAARAVHGMRPGPAVPRLVLRLRRLLGQIPEVTRFHPRWNDLQLPIARCRRLATDSSNRWLVAASGSTPMTEWLRKQALGVEFIFFRRLLRNGIARGLEPGSFDIAFVELMANDIPNMSMVLQTIATLVRPGGQIIVSAMSENWSVDPDYFGREISEAIGPLARSGLWPIEHEIISTGRIRWWMNHLAITGARSILEQSGFLLPFHIIGAVVLCPLAVGANLISTWRLKGSVPSSVFLRFLVEVPASASG